MVAASLKSKNKQLDVNNIFKYKSNMNLVKTAAIYGSNASGKSNFIKAFVFMRDFVINSSKETQATEDIEVENFRLCSATEDKESFFEVIFVIDDVRYRYGFELNKHCIKSEWLYRAKVRETNLFLRENDKIVPSGSFPEGKGLEEKTRENALFLSACAQWNGKISRLLLKWFKACGIISGLNDMGYRPFTERQLEDANYRDSILSFVKEFDLGISGLKIERSSITSDSLPKDFPKELRKIILDSGGEKTTISTTHKKYDENNEYVGDVVFDLDENESDGTKKAFSFSGPLLDILENGLVLFVDELDARFHPIITQAIVQMFHDKYINSKNAQLIFVTHDTNLLDNCFFRRDQIWFTEKNQYGATDLYSLVDFKVRNDAAFEKDYIAGKYGAIPFLGGFQRLGDK
jgi:AAA15 family ATPase/GTPase